LIPLPIEETSFVARAEGLCPYARAFVNDASADSADGIIVTTLCDQMRRVYDLLVRGVRKPVFLLNVPKTWQTVAAQKLYMDELERLSRFLVHLGGRTPTNDELARAMTDVGCAVHTVCVAGIPPAGAAGVQPSNRGRDTRGTRGQGVPNAEFCVGEPHDALDTRDGVHGTPYIPIAVVGGPLMQKDRVLFDLIEECGGRVVLDATETGRRGQRRAFDRRRLAEDPRMELADAYFSIPDASRRPNSELYRWLKEELAKTDAQGIVFHHYVWCDAWRAELARLKEWADLPVLGLDSDGRSGTNLARSHTRIRAFLEMLQ
jgi:benzoyl-CoA reductase/2-hydroxyglutaryl-CoA dehydratase subunit BcrC/BadD/HgdB